MPDISAAEIADRAGGEIAGDPAVRIRAVASLDAAQAHDLSFIANARYASRARATSAGAVLIPRSLTCELPKGVTAIRVEDPYVVLAWLLPLLYPEPPRQAGVHPTAVVPSSAHLGGDVLIEAYVVIGENVRIGSGARIAAHSVLGDGCLVGENTLIHPHVTLHPGVVVGARGVIHSGARLGGVAFVPSAGTGETSRLQPVGKCEIGDDVEIGANATIERGLAGTTMIGNGTKLDNLVHIGHDARIGRHVLLVAQVAVSPNTVIEDGVILGGQAGVAEHVRIGRSARVAGKSGVTRNVEEGEIVSGYPARPHREAMRAQAALFRLPAMFKKLQELERSIRNLRGIDPG